MYVPRPYLTNSFRVGRATSNPDPGLSHRADLRGVAFHVEGAWAEAKHEDGDHHCEEAHEVHAAADDHTHRGGQPQRSRRGEAVHLVQLRRGTTMKMCELTFGGNINASA